jgi:hypothetical protein
MKKTTTLLAVALIALAMLFAINVKAQTAPVKQTTGAWGLGIGLEAGIPTGNATDISNFELGGTARLQYKGSSDFALMLTTGYYSMVGKTITGSTSGSKYPSLGMVPLKAGAKYYATPGFYLDGEAGFGFDTNYENHTKLILSPGLGFESGSLDISLRYENYSGQNNSFGLVGLRVGYEFGL